MPSPLLPAGLLRLCGLAHEACDRHPFLPPLAADTSISMFVLSISQVLKGQLLTFLTIFLMILSSIVFCLITIFPDHPAVGMPPQAPQMGHPFLGAYSLLMAGLTGEPLDLNLHPEFLEPLGGWQKLNLAVFVCLYIFYIFFALILLLNLLIALLIATFRETQEDATLQGRIAFAHTVIRSELVCDFFNMNTWAGEADGGKHYHLFRNVAHDDDGELPSGHTDQNVFTKMTLPTRTASGVLTSPPSDASAALAKASLEVRELRSGLRSEIERAITAQVKPGIRGEVSKVVAELRTELGSQLGNATKKLKEEVGSTSALVTAKVGETAVQMAGLPAEIKAELRAELAVQMAGLPAEIKAEMRAEMSDTVQSIRQDMTLLKSELIDALGEMRTSQQAASPLSAATASKAPRLGL